MDANGRQQRTEAIAAFADRFLQGPNRDLYEDMLVTVCRLAHDEQEIGGHPRGDIKLLHRALAELRYALKTFAPYQQTRKISIFGSARTASDHPDYQAAVAFARQVCAAGWMVITGAGGGIMEAGHGGAGRDASFGVAIRLPFEQMTNEIIADDTKLVNFQYFFTRKLMFIKEASAVALFPGGFGTQDEGFEALTLVQTGKSAMVPIVLCEQPGGTYWPHWRRYVEDELLQAGMINPEDLELLTIADSVEQAVQVVLDFFRVYHSSRFVGDEFVIRLQQPVGDAVVEQLNDEFAGLLLRGGRIERSGPQADEQGAYPELPRLRMPFDRKSYGHLRRLINVLNASAAAGVETP